MNLIEERTIALAGVMQASKQVQLLARTGDCDSADADVCLQSVLILDAVNTPSVFGGINGVRAGLQMIKDGVLNSASIENVELLRYAMSILHLQSQMYRDEQKFRVFGQEVERLSGCSDDELVGACSIIYQDHVSNMRPQIIVQGEQNFLQRPEVPPRIRALLLAAFRSAVLWQQKGGTRFKMLWQRTRMQNAAQDLLQSALVH